MRKAQQIAKRFIADLPAKITLTYIDRDDHLNHDQMQRCFESPSERAGAEEEINENFRDYTDDRVREIIEERLDTDDIETLKADEDSYYLVSDTIFERDDSDIIDALWRNTRDALMRYRLCENNVDEFPISRCEDTNATTPEEIAQMLGVSYLQFKDELHELRDNASYGGSLEIIWYGDVDELAKKSKEKADGTWEHCGFLTFFDPHVLVIDTINGSGHDVRLKGATINLPFDPSRLIIDEAKRNGYGWDSIASVNKSAYDTRVEHSKTRLVRAVRSDRLVALPTFASTPIFA